MMSSSDGLSAIKTAMNLFAACTAVLHVGERGIFSLTVCGARARFLSRFVEDTRFSLGLLERNTRGPKFTKRKQIYLVIFVSLLFETVYYHVLMTPLLQHTRYQCKDCQYNLFLKIRKEIYSFIFVFLLFSKMKKNRFYNT